MSTEISAEAVAEPVEIVVESQEAKERRERISDQIDLSRAVIDYVEAKEKYERASESYNFSSHAVREKVKPNTVVVIRKGHYGKHYLVTSDSDSNIEVKEIEVI